MLKQLAIQYLLSTLTAKGVEALVPVLVKAGPEGRAALRSALDVADRKAAAK